MEQSSPQPSRERGRPVRGAIAGFFFGLFVSLDLVVFGVLALDADVLALIPLLGLAAGIALGVIAPLHRSASGEKKRRARTPVVGGPEPGAV